jgi:transketolase
MSDLTERGKQIRRDTIELALANGGYHWGGSFSCVEILIALFDYVMREDDMFILSKGHSCWPYYVLLREKGFTPKLTGHPSMGDGVPFSTGSLGHGLPLGIGVALAKKIRGEPGRVFVLVGDGEIQEGTFWESLLIARQQDLKNIICIIDNNKIQGSGKNIHFVGSKVLMDMRWRYQKIEDGHSIGELSNLDCDLSVPLIVNAQTVKGKGVSFMENKPEWHSKWLDKDHKEKAMGELR